MKIKINDNEIIGNDEDIIKIVSEVISNKKHSVYKIKDDLLFKNDNGIRLTPLMKEEG